MVVNTQQQQRDRKKEGEREERRDPMGFLPLASQVNASRLNYFLPPLRFVGRFSVLLIQAIRKRICSDCNSKLTPKSCPEMVYFLVAPPTYPPPLPEFLPWLHWIATFGLATRDGDARSDLIYTAIFLWSFMLVVNAQVSSSSRNSAVILHLLVVEAGG